MTLIPARTARWLLLCLGFVALAACRRDSEPAPPRAPEPDPSDPVASIPRDRLYGATPEENLHVLPLELEVRDLPAGWDGGRFAVIAGPKLGGWAGNVEVLAAALRRAAAERPDALLLIGDFISEGQSAVPLRQALAGLGGGPTFAILGPRDVRTDSIEARVTQALSDRGIRVLRNARASLGRGGDTISLGGLDPELATDPAWRQAEVFNALSGGRPIPLLLAHHPALAIRATEHAFPLIVAGNTFCGVVEIPGTPRLGWYRETGLQLQHFQIGEQQRLFRLRGNALFLTCGIGFGFIPMQLGAAPEIVLITLRRAGMPPAPDQAALDTVLPDTLLPDPGPPQAAPAPAQPEP
jgi:uncharacterized protein